MRSPRSLLITGASSGIGAALARLYARDGARLALTGRSESRPAEVVDACRLQDADVIAKTVNVTDREAMSAYIERCEKRAPLDLVIANAGVDSWAFQGDERYYRTFEINVIGVLNTILPVLPAMQSRGRGQIAVMSSLAGYHGLPTAPAYCASKAAVRSLGEALRGQLASSGICVSVITPGFVDTPLTQGSRLPMPFKWPADRAAEHIRRKLACNSGRIAFPWQLYALVWLINALPQALADRLLTRTPSQKYR